MPGKRNHKSILTLMPRRWHYLLDGAKSPDTNIIACKTPALLLLAILPLLIPTKSFAQWTNEPPGSTTILDCPFSGPQSECGINDVYHSTTHMDDPSAPISPPGVSVDTLQPFAKTGGSQQSYLFGNNYDEVYMGMMVRSNPEFQGRVVGNKMFFLKGPDSNGVWILSPESRLQPSGTLIFMVNSGEFDNSHTCAADRGLICYANAGGDWLVKGQWTKIEAYVKKSTTETSRDGIVRWWINGKLAGNYTNMNYADAGLDEWVWTETWDGAGDMGTSNTVPWYWYIDHLYLSIPHCPDGCKNSGWKNLPPGGGSGSGGIGGGGGSTEPVPPGEGTDTPHKKMTLPVPGKIIMEHGSLADPNEVQDFDPHFGLFPLTIPAPLPVFARKLWCYGPLYVCYYFCYCLPIPKNWCWEFPECFATNIVNLEATLWIKHAWPEGEGRLDPPSRFTVTPTDNYARDMCVNGATLGYDKFDPNTGKLAVPINPDTGAPINSSGYDERATGFVTGARPERNSCMATIDTPVFNPLSDVSNQKGGTMYSYYENMMNYPFRSYDAALKTVGSDTAARVNIYGTSNRYLSTTFFLGGELGCPDWVYQPKDKDTGKAREPKNGLEWLDGAGACYDYFMYQRAAHPEWTMERTGVSTDDPLSLPPERGGNPDLAIFNSCQPLMNGHDAKLVAKGASPIGKGYSPVLQYQRPDLDEAEYSPMGQLQKTFKKRFPQVPLPAFQDYFPCLTQPQDAGPMKVTDWDTFNTTLLINYAISFSVEVVFLPDVEAGPMYFVPISNQDSYQSPGKGKDGFCPNVEKINDPTNPFAPRDDFLNVEGVNPRPADGINLGAQLARYAKLAALANADQFKFSPANTWIYSTDREYSFQTRVFTPRERILNDWEFAYSDFDPLNPAANFESLKHPEVMCAVVPVDILEPRRKAFNNCIMQRINFNFTTFRRRNFLSTYYKNTLAPWKKPCVTRFWEKDNYSECPVSMSIQQCCRIIVKDVVPSNYVKIRTCEGLRQKRDMIFGFNHIYDYAAKPNEISTTEADGSITKIDSPIPVTSPGGLAIRSPVRLEGYDADNPDAFIDPNAPQDFDKAKEAYDAIYDINQKLTMVGCDNTEPRTLRFDYYFPRSTWKEIPGTNEITDGIKELQKQSDELIKMARDDAKKLTLLETPTIWSGFNEIKVTGDSIVKSLQLIWEKTAKETADAQVEYGNTLRDIGIMTTRQNLALMTANVLPIDLPAALAGRLQEAIGNYILKKAISDAAFILFDEARTVNKAAILTEENFVRNAIMEMLDFEQQSIIDNGKAVADQLMIDGVQSIQSSVGPKLSQAVDQAYGVLNSNIVSKEAMAVAGEGGSHMPYMRWWDTGTSAGNPLHGGSFINTLGSYDTIIGVGHEERSFNDATSTATDISEETDPEAIAAAKKEVDDANTKLAEARDTLFNALNDWNNNSGSGIPGTPIWDGDTILQSADNRVGISGICQLSPPGTDCTAFNTDFPILQNNVNAASSAVQAANESLEAANGELFSSDSSSGIELKPWQSLTQSAKMGRIGGWDGVKAHQMWTLHRQNLSCIGRYEKLFKPFSAEDFVLARAGANYTTKNGNQFPWPLAWRGYINDPDNDFQKHKYTDGLDYAQKGDIIIYMVNGLRRIAYVSKVNTYEPKFVKIESWDQGKFPSATGSSISLGTGVERLIFKDKVPTAARKFKPEKPITVGIGPVSELLDISAIDEVAKVNGQPSCEDPDFTSCVLGGPGAINNDGPSYPNSTWDDVEIYRPSLDTEQRQCPLINTASGIDGKPDFITTNLSSENFAFCVNAGYDPPPSYVIGYNGAGAGNVSDTTLCGVDWGDCKSTDKEHRCFPGGQICYSATGVEQIPEAPPEDTKACTADELKEAAKAYREYVKSLQDGVSEKQKAAQAKMLAAQARVKALLNNYNSLKSESARLGAQKNGTSAASQAGTKLSTLNTQLAQAQSELTAAQAMTIPAPIIDSSSGKPVVTNQAEIDAATKAKQDKITSLQNQISTLNSGITEQKDIVQTGTDLNNEATRLANLQAEETAARNSLNDYIASHSGSDSSDPAIVDNIAKLDAAATEAHNAVVASQNRIDSIQGTLGNMTSLDPEVLAQQEKDKETLAAMEAEIERAKNAADAAEEEATQLPERIQPAPFTCPWNGPDDLGLDGSEVSGSGGEYVPPTQSGSGNGTNGGSTTTGTTTGTTTTTTP